MLLISARSVPKFAMPAQKNVKNMRSMEWSIAGNVQKLVAVAQKSVEKWLVLQLNVSRLPFKSSSLLYLNLFLIEKC